MPIHIYRIDGIVPIDVNHCYWFTKFTRKKYLNPTAKGYKAALCNEFAEQDLNREKPSWPYLGLVILLAIPRDQIFYKRKTDKLKGWDVSNYIKLIEDAYAEYVGIDDTNNLMVTATKYISADGEWHMELWVSEADLMELK